MSLSIATTPPPLDIPDSLNTVAVSIINTTARIDRLPTSYHYDHSYPGFDYLNCPCLAFLIEHGPSGRKVLFDLGMRKDWENLPPSIVKMIRAVGAKITVEKNVADILEEGGIDLKSITDIIWSHHHCDHTGLTTPFPLSTTLHVGPGFKTEFTPGYPSNPDAQILESDYEGRALHELSFASSSSPTCLSINGFPALDFFADGSFYLLSAPGHSVAHICALARTTPATANRDASFLFMGADCVHHAGELRPSRYLPLPRDISAPSTDTPYPPAHISTPSSSEVKASTQPMLVCKSEATHDATETRETIEKVQVFDRSADVLVVAAHDESLMGVLGFWPEGANTWRERGWKGRGLWGWMGDVA